MLVSYLLRKYSYRQSMLILKADFCVFGFVYDEAISIIQWKQHKNPIISPTAFAKNSAADFLLQKVTQYAK